MLGDIELSSYLEIAAYVLRSEKRPLSARAILREAYASGIVPHHLFGPTQHKTLQARLSEDILRFRESSLFFRTKPGVFFLREFIVDDTVPNEFKRSIVARRRTRDLFRGPALTISRRDIPETLFSSKYVSGDLLNDIFLKGQYRYVDRKKLDDDDILIWAASSLTKPGKILSYRTGRYRDDRDDFANKRSVTFSTLVSDSDRTFFDYDHFGITDRAFYSAAIDLDFVRTLTTDIDEKFARKIRFLSFDKHQKRASLLAYVEIEAPNWFEPSASKLSLTDLRWLDLNIAPNNWEDFDPWSQMILGYGLGQSSLHGY
ncbi:winged helix-turn-helix domain-containing protein [Ochrobactrum sp. BTU1]|jgi:hypothetical protein|uniref:winged helix-turn-helix domain-containing protein n=1 Tax=Ochrobactrum sp. BTU1 TaxID=2840456 RepID=UPI001C040065|nr:winged helix-turn-helix domain-containing protein [Ochrobactrum sp. BTU1]